MTSAPDYRTRFEGPSCREVVFNTYKYAREAGDENVYFIGGELLFGDDYVYSTVDGCHPNDIGFYRMAEAYVKVLKPILSAEK